MNNFQITALSKKNVLMTAAATVAELTSILIDVAASKPNDTVTSGIFTRCDGYSGPIGDIKISSCPDRDEVGFCDIGIRYSPSFYLSFTPARDIVKPVFSIVGPDGFRFEDDMCQGPIECPAKAGKRLVRWSKCSMAAVGRGRSTQFKLIVFDSSTETKDVFYCAEFPARVNF